MTSRRSRGARAIPVLLGLSLFVAACSSDDSGEADETSAPVTTVADGSSTTVADGTATTVADGSSTTTGNTTAPVVDADTSRRLVLVATDGVQQMDPVTGVVPCEAEMLRWVYDSLIRQAPDGTLVPGLAESWESPDPMTFTLHLRQGVKFQDGTDFNADAVKQHIERSKTLTTSAISNQLASVASVETPDDHTVVLHLSEARAGILPSVFTDRAGMVPSPTVVAAEGDTYGATDAVGAGPYKYDSHTPTEDLHVTAWDGYWDAEHRHLAGIDMLGNASEFQTQRIADGELDYAAMKDTQLAEAEQAKETGGVDFKLSPTTQYAEIYVNWTVAPFDNLLVRQALEYSIDRDLLAQSLTDGSATPAHSPLSAESWAHDPAIDGLYNYDPAKAKSLLAEAGYPDGVTVKVGQIDNPYYTRLTQAIQDMVKESGFNFELETVTGTEINNRLYQTKDLPVAVTAFRGTADPGLTLEQKYASTGNSNPAGTTVDGVDELLAAGAASVDQNDRAADYMKAEKLIMENALSIPIYHNGGLVAFVPELKGVQKGYTTCQFGDFVSAEVYFQK